MEIKGKTKAEVKKCKNSKDKGSRTKVGLYRKCKSENKNKDKSKDKS